MTGRNLTPMRFLKKTETLESRFLTEIRSTLRSRRAHINFERAALPNSLHFLVAPSLLIMCAWPEHVFLSLVEARETIEAWRLDYNHRHTQAWASSAGRVTWPKSLPSVGMLLLGGSTTGGLYL